ncbi:MAG: hypothetical protein VW338_03835 [Rhodospirillaceae bacterium]
MLSSRNHLPPKIAYVEQLTLQRSALEGVIETPLGALRFYSVHLGHVGAAERAAQIQALMAIFFDGPERGGVVSGSKASRHWTADQIPPPMPVSAVLLGDFNLFPLDAENELLVGGTDTKYGRLITTRHLVDAWSAAGRALTDGHTCFAHAGAAPRIDYALVTPDLAPRILSVTVDADAQGSDHQPVRLDLT